MGDCYKEELNKIKENNIWVFVFYDLLFI
jgi:hypothetical protein